MPEATDLEAERSLDELEQLAQAAGAEVVGRVLQERDRRHSRTFIGPGKVVEIGEMAKALGATMVLFDDELSPSQQQNIEADVTVKVLDRTALILDIFAQRAQSSEGKMQVELAQLEYNMPRLRGLWLHLERLGGGIGTRGPGETQLESDRRRARQRIQQIRRELKGVARARETQRKQRRKSSVYTASLVGYTNAGKSTLLNTLTGAHVLVEDKLFATLDSTSRRLSIGNHQPIVVSDTVGFINKLPHQLVAAFRSTLDEVREADLLLHVVDASSQDMEDQIRAVERVLKEIGVEEKPVLLVLNKIDLLDQAERLRLKMLCKDAIMVSAESGEGSEELIDAIEEKLSANFVKVKLAVPYANGDVVQKVHDSGKVLAEDHREDGTHIEVELPKTELPKVSRYVEG
ncbi:MAG: GTPase HflX [Candidatus Aquicultorales bacterium]